MSTRVRVIALMNTQWVEDRRLRMLYIPRTYMSSSYLLQPAVLPGNQPAVLSPPWTDTCVSALAKQPLA